MDLYSFLMEFLEKQLQIYLAALINNNKHFAGKKETTHRIHSIVPFYGVLREAKLIYIEKSQWSSCWAFGINSEGDHCGSPEKLN